MIWFASSDAKNNTAVATSLQIIETLTPIIEAGQTDGSIRTNVALKETVITIINTFGTFGNNVVLKSAISFTEEDIEPYIQQHVLKEILLSYVRPR